MEYFIYVSTHVTSSSFMDSAISVALSMFNGESVKYSTLLNLFVYIQKFQVKIQHFYFVSTHVTSSSFMYSASEVAVSILTGKFVKYSTLLNLFVCR